MTSRFPDSHEVLAYREWLNSFLFEITLIDPTVLKRDGRRCKERSRRRGISFLLVCGFFNPYCLSMFRADLQTWAVWCLPALRQVVVRAGNGGAHVGGEVVLGNVG